MGSHKSKEEQESVRLKQILHLDPDLKQQHDKLFNQYQESKRLYIKFRSDILNNSSSPKIEPIHLEKEAEEEEEILKDKHTIDQIKDNILSNPQRINAIKKMIRRQGEVERELSRQFNEIVDPKDIVQFQEKVYNTMRTLQMEFMKVIGENFKIDCFCIDQVDNDLRRLAIDYIQQKIEEL